MKKILFILILMFVFGFCNQKNTFIKIDNLKCFTHAENNVLTLYKSHKGDVLENIGPDLEAGWLVVITAKQGEYFRINFDSTHKDQENELYFEDVWVKKGDLSINTQNYQPYGDILYLHKNPDSKSKLVGAIYEAQTVSILDVSGDWVYISGIGKRDRKTSGWIDKSLLCGNPYTSCC